MICKSCKTDVDPEFEDRCGDCGESTCKDCIKDGQCPYCVEKAQHYSNSRCAHNNYDFKQHGRHCTCGKLMVDFGD